MAYIDTDNLDELLNDINYRKEFAQYKVPKGQINIPGSDISDSLNYEDAFDVNWVESNLYAKHFMRLHSAQEFINNYTNPSTKFKRMHLQWETGMGKTIASLCAAIHYLDYFRKQIANNQEVTGTIFIIGFNQEIFKKELLRHPEFGFVKHEEIKYMDKLKHLTASGSHYDIEKYQDYVTNLKKRLTNRKRGGFFKFFGYREFLNRIFILTSKKSKIMLSNMSENQLLDAVKDGSLAFNSTLINSFKNSLLICDEIHNVYNSLQKNNWGIAIQAVLNKQPSVRVLFLSATPINNSPTEIVDLLNLLGADPPLKKSDLFNRDALKEGALEIIKRESAGKFSYLRDLNTKYVPQREIIGEEIPGIPYLKFKRTQISDFHLKFYKQQYHETFSNEDQYLSDLILPHPDPNKAIYKYNDIAAVYSNCDVSWKEKTGIEYKDGLVTGSFMKIGNLSKYSPKYDSAVKDLIRGIRLGRGKSIIYTNIVQMSGALFAQEILKNNGFIDTHSLPSQDTLCAYCGFEKSMHGNKWSIKSDDDFKKISQIDEFYSGIELSGSKKDKYLKIMKTRFETQHGYLPCRFTMIHSRMDKSANYKNMEMFNSPANTDGSKCMVLVGSQMIKESFDFKAVFNMMIIIAPDNISTLIQIFGRIVRKGSFELLPFNKRKVWIRIYTNTLPNELSHEEKFYMKKMKAYLIVQQIEKAIHEVAIDSYIHYNLTFPEGTADIKPDLGTLVFKPDVVPKKDLNLSDLNVDTFSVYFAKKEVTELVYLIKRMFLLEPVWTYDSLWVAIKSPPKEWDMVQNPKYFIEDNFKIALSKLLWMHNSPEYIEPIFDLYSNDEFYHRLFNQNDKIIMTNGIKHIVVQQDIYLILTPIIDQQPIIDYDTCYRPFVVESNTSFNINLYMNQRSILDEYDNKKLKFIQKYKDMELTEMDTAICDYGSEFHKLLLEDCIEFIYNFWTGGRNRSEYMEFYFKMLYYYDLIGIIFWANSLKTNIKNRYREYISQSKSVVSLSKGIEDEEVIDSSSDEEDFNKDVIKILKSTINQKWCPEPEEKKFSNILASTLELAKNPKVVPKVVPGNMLPVGHFMSQLPRFYYKGKWEDVSDYVYGIKRDWVENNIIIGYDEKSATGSHIRFKLRSPLDKSKHIKDNRQIERGSVCASKPKPYLIDICNKLKILLPKKINVTILCTSIRRKLIMNEIQERKKDSKIKWFYYYFEPINQE
jgi:superfamily II DNA or RNA helicase